MGVYRQTDVGEMDPGIMPGIVQMCEGGGHSFLIATSRSFYADFHNVSCLLDIVYGIYLVKNSQHVV